MLREVDTGDEHSLRYPGRTLVGRARVNDIQPNHGSVSKQHAVVCAAMITLCELIAKSVIGLIG